MADVDERSDEKEAACSDASQTTCCDDDGIGGNEVATTANDQKPGSLPTAHSSTVDEEAHIAEEHSDREDTNPLADCILATGSADGLSVMLATCPVTASKALANIIRVEGERAPQTAQLALPRCTTESALKVDCR